MIPSYINVMICLDLYSCLSACKKLKHYLLLEKRCLLLCDLTTSMTALCQWCFFIIHESKKVSICIYLLPALKLLSCQDFQFVGHHFQKCEAFVEFCKHKRVCTTHECTLCRDSCWPKSNSVLCSLCNPCQSL